MAADDGQFTGSFVLEKLETKVTTEYADWKISNTLTCFRRHDARLLAGNGCVDIPGGSTLWLSRPNSTKEHARFEEFIEFLKKVDQARQEAFYTRCVAVEVTSTCIVVTREEDSVFHAINKRWLPKQFYNPGDSFLVLRSLFDDRGPMDMHPIVSMENNVFNGKVYPHKLIRRTVCEDGKVAEYHCPDMNATPRVIVTGKTYSDECLDF